MAKRILALVSEPIGGEELRSAVGADALRDAEVLVVAPALISRTRFFFADPDGAIERAHDVADESVAQLDSAEVDATGDSGESDPLLAIQDALATFPADEIVLFTHPDSERNWLEEGIVDEAKQRFDPPVTHIVLPER